MRSIDMTPFCKKVKFRLKVPLNLHKSYIYNLISNIMDRSRTQINNLVDSSNQSDQQYQVLGPDPENLPIQQQKHEETVSIRLNDYYVVITHSQALLSFNEQSQWKQLLSYSFLKRQSSISVIGLNSIINILDSDRKTREMIWNSVIKQLQILRNENIESRQLEQKEIKQISTLIDKYMKKMQIKQEQEQQIASIMLQVISKYQQQELHIGSLKGLEYICYGIYQSSPVKTPEKIFNAFKYIMDIENVKQIFYSGSPLIFSEVDILCEMLKIDAPMLYKYLSDLNINWGQIFVSYYRSLMLNKLKNTKIMSKILDLIIVYGISIVRMILVRIMSSQEKELMQYQKDNEGLDKFLGTQLVYLYLQAELEKLMKQQEQKIKDSNKKMNQIKLESQQEMVTKIFRKLIIGI